MINTQSSKFQKSMNKAQRTQNQIRHISISGFFDNGQRYLYNNLIQKWGISNHADKQHIDNEQEFVQELQSQCNIKNIYYKKKNNNNGEEEGYLINLMKSTNKYNKQTEGLSRLSDGAIIIINFGQYINHELETIIRTFLKEQNPMVFLINKMDKAFLKQNLSGEQIYLTLHNQIERITQIIQLYQQDKILSPADGQVIFGSAKQQWGFNCLQFAQFYEKKFNIEHIRLAEKLWGDHYFDTQTKQWSNSSINKESQELKRAFVAFILDPIMKLSKAIMNGEKDIVYQMTERIGIKLTDEIKEQEGKKLLISIFDLWINLSEIVVQSCIFHIPPPRIAQNQKVAKLFKQYKDDQLYESIKNCDPKGPLVISVCFMISDKQEFISIGRVFSGTIHSGQEIRIHGALYQFIKTSYKCDDDIFEEVEEQAYQRVDQTFQSIGQTFCFPTEKPTSIEYVPAGNIVGIKGIDKFVKGICTISDPRNPIQMTPLQYQQDYQVRINITPKDPKDLNILIEAIRQLTKLNPTISFQLDPCLMLIGNSYHYLQYFVEELTNKNLKNIEIKKSNYFINYNETITGKSNQNEIKSLNNHNIIKGEAIPLNEKLINLIESNNQSEIQQLDKNTKNWFQDEKLEIFAFGPNNKGPNIIVNKSLPDESYSIYEIEEHLNVTWQWFTKEGALCEEGVRGMQLNVLKFLSHAGNIYKEPYQIIPAARKLCQGCQLQAKPRLQEPVFSVEIYSNISVIDQVYKCLNNSQGIILEEKKLPETSSSQIKAYVRGPNIVQFHDQLTLMTQNKAYSLSQLDHWLTLNSDPLQQGSEANQIMQEIRAYKGLPIQIPQYL